VALARAVIALMRGGGFEPSRSLAIRMEEISPRAARSDPPSGQPYNTGDPGSFLLLSEAALQKLEEAGDLAAAAAQRIALGEAYRALGQNARAAAVFEAAMRSDDASIVSAARRGLALVLADPNEARRHAEGLSRARVELAAGNAAAAIEHTDASAEGRALRARALVQMGRLEDALSDARAALSLATSEADEITARLALIEGLLASGDIEGARRAAHSAEERLHQRAMKIRDPELRRTFLADVPEHRRILDLAKTLR
jgi:tetratricopeptide (TPR) repeat protein